MFSKTLKYYTAWFTRALKENVKFFDYHTAKGRFRLLPSSLVLLLVFWLFFGQSPTTADWIKLGGIILSFGVTWVIGLIFQMAIAAVKIDLDKESKIDLLDEENNRLQEKMVPKFEILFGEGGSYRHQVSESEVLYRVCIHNLSSVTIRSIVAKLEKIEPGNSLPLPVKLRQMHDTPRFGDPFKDSFDLNPDESVFIDVLFVREEAGSHSFGISHIVGGVSQGISRNVSKLTVVAHAQDCAAVRRDFRIAPKNGEVRFEPA